MSALRHDWQKQEVAELFAKPFFELIYMAHTSHRAHFDPQAVQLSTLLSLKTGACPEDCKYCSQSAYYDTPIEKQKMMGIDEVKAAVEKAKQAGASRFCMACGWRHPRPKDFPHLLELIKLVKAEGMEVCMSLGMLSDEQVAALEAAGLDYCNHNLDTSEEYYDKVTTTRRYADRLDTLDKIRASKIKVCCGGIMGLGETEEDRISFLCQLANMPSHPESVPINRLVKIPGTPFADQPDVDEFDFVRVIAVARLMMPKSFVRLSAGRNTMSASLQALCFFAGANSIHYGEKLLTTPLPDTEKDQALFARLGLKAYEPNQEASEA